MDRLLLALSLALSMISAFGVQAQGCGVRCSESQVNGLESSSLHTLRQELESDGLHLASVCNRPSRLTGDQRDLSPYEDTIEDTELSAEDALHARASKYIRCVAPTRGPTHNFASTTAPGVFRRLYLNYHQLKLDISIA